MSGLGFTHWGALAAIAFGISFCTIDYANAQITPDGTLPNNSSVTQDGKTFDITGGTQVGGNLFHSFKEFSIRTGDTASFNSITPIENIFSRVTGKSVSNIDGLIRANGTANLFLINPNGIIFGPNASLNINGSFVGTTANAVGLANGDIFSTNPVGSIPTKLLNINPSVFFFNQIAAPVTVKSRRDVGLGLSVLYPDPNNLEPIYEGLKVSNGQSLLLVGGDINLDGGVLQAPGGQVDLGGALGSGTIGLNVDGNNLRLSFPNDTARANVSLTNEALVDVIAGDGGSITINARSLDIFKSRLTAGIGEGLGTTNSQAGNITLNATESVRIGQKSPFPTSLIINYAQSNAIGKTGNINIKAGSSFIIDSALLQTDNLGTGDSGNISLEASANSSLINTLISTYSLERDSGNFLVKVNGDLSFLVYSDPSFEWYNYIYAGTLGKGDAGDISIYANGNVTFAKTSISSGASGAKDSIGRGFPEQGNAGAISIQANGNVAFSDNSSINSFSTGEGDAGRVSIQANGNVAFSDNSSISSYTIAEGNAGNVSIQADNNVSFVNSFISSSTFDEGKGGDIQIQARSISLTEGAAFLAITEGGKNAGNIQIEAKDFVTLSGVNVEGFSSGLFTDTEEASAQGGNITVRTGALNILDGAVLSARSRSDFDGGDIKVDVNTLKISDGGQILTTAFSGGNAGNINVNATDNITLAGSDPTYFERLAKYDDNFTVDPVSPASGLFSNTFINSTGNGGTIELSTANLTVRDGAQISASTTGQGDAGNVTLNANSLSTFNGGQLRTSTSSAGQAGNITANVSDIYLSGSSSGLFAQTTGIGSAGDIALQPGQQSQSLTANFFDGAQISVSTSGSGQGGNVTILAPESITLSGSGTLTAISEGNASGRAGDVFLATEKLSVVNGMRVSAATNSTNPAASGGNLTVQTSQLNLTDGSSLEAGTAGTAPGGDLIIQPNGNGQNLAVNFTGGATVSAASSGSGKGGAVSINAPESINLTGNGSVISAETTGQGAGGDLTLTTGKLVVQDGAKITVSSIGSGFAGDLKVNANSIYLNNAAKITADTTGGGGNIFLRSRLLLLSNQSSITTNAQGSGIPGGNINIDTDFLIAFKNSDISANSTNFRGGNVRINAQGIFGTQFRDVASDSTSDITATGASSEFSGSVELNTPGIDPNSGLVELPTIGVETEVAQVCDSPGYAQSSFIITGRGGLPPNPTKDILPNDAVNVGWVSLKPSGNANAGLRPRSNPPATNRALTTPERIVEASGWALNEKGEVVLTANVTAGGRGSLHQGVPCSVSQAAHQ